MHVHAVEYHSVLQGKGILTHITMCMNLENSMLSEVSRSQKTYCMIPLILDT